MATAVEEARVRVAELTEQIRAEEARFDDENLPSKEDEARLEAMYNARADVQEQLDRAKRIGDRSASDRANGNRPNPAKAPVRSNISTLGQRFVERPEYKEWLARIAPTGVVADSTKGITSPPMHFKGLRELAENSQLMKMNAALLTGLSDTSAGALIINDRYAPITELGRRPLTILDVITILQTDSDAVDFARITGETFNAAPVAEATASSGSSGVKPESEMALEKVTTTVKTIAHWMAATKRALSDASQLRGLIDNFLEYGLDLELEDQIVTGAGTGENFTGIENTSGIQTQAYDTSILTTTRQARRKVLTVGRRRPNAFLMHPIDWETIDLLQDAENRYYFGGPMAMGTPRLWGLPVIESEAVTQGFALVGDFTTCVLWDREDTAISISDSHSDFFIRNLVAVLAELRAAFGVLKPNAIVRADLTA